MNPVSPLSTSTPYVNSCCDHSYVPTVKAYRNDAFMNSHEGRSIRIMTEFEEPEYRFAKHGVLGTVLFFGSARSMTPEDYARTTEDLEKRIATVGSEEKVPLQRRLEKLQKTQWMCASYESVRQLARKVTEWSLDNEDLREKLEQELPAFMRQVANRNFQSQSNPPLIVATGGGPGFMQAANHGASDVEGAVSMGMAISLPFEKGVNPYVSPELAFEFHYFFTRKFWMMYSAKAIVIAPGGFGTCDELFEALTLKQTGKLANIPIVLFGCEYWRKVINWAAFVEMGTISQEDVDELYFTDNVEEAFEYLKVSIMKQSEKLPKVSIEQKNAPDPVLRMESSISIFNK